MDNLFLKNTYVRKLIKIFMLNKGKWHPSVVPAKYKVRKYQSFFTHPKKIHIIVEKHEGTELPYKLQLLFLARKARKNKNNVFSCHLDKNGTSCYTDNLENVFCVQSMINE